MTVLIQCTGCRALVPDIDGPTHRYIGASPGCWQSYGELLARGYALDRDKPGYGPAHRLVVDTYAAQHPGVPGKQSSQSVAAHLFILCLVLERGVDPAFSTRAITQFVEKHKARGLTWMEPPPSLGELTVLDVMSASSAKDHASKVMRWTESVWQAWKPHHVKVRAWADEFDQKPSHK